MPSLLEQSPGLLAVAAIMAVTLGTLWLLGASG